jgi:hypothetical protein
MPNGESGGDGGSPENHSTAGNAEEERPSTVPAKGATKNSLREKGKEHDHKERRENLQLFFNGILTVCSVITLGALLYQNVVLNATLVATNRQAVASDRQAIASEKAVNVAADTLTAMKAEAESSGKESRERMRAEDSRAKKALDEGAAQNAATLKAMADQIEAAQRALIGIHEIRPVQLPGITNAPFFVVVTNFGKSPAVDVFMVAATIGLRPSESVDPIRRIKADPNLRLRNNGVIDPGTFRTFRIPITVVPRPDIDEVRTGTLIFYIYGQFTYRDTLSKVIHRTTFCYSLRVEALEPIGFSACEEENSNQSD